MKLNEVWMPASNDRTGTKGEKGGAYVSDKPKPTHGDYKKAAKSLKLSGDDPKADAWKLHKHLEKEGFFSNLPAANAAIKRGLA